MGIPRWVMAVFVLVGAMATSVRADDMILESGFVESGGEQIYYEAVGAGHPIILSHGLGGNHAIWYQQVPELARSFRVITWDQRGFGRSTNTQDLASPRVAAEDLLALFDHLQIDRAHLVGQSMGGWAVIGFTLDHPERVSKLVLADTIGGIYTQAISDGFDAYIRSAMSSPPPNRLPITQHPALGERIGIEDPAQAFLYRQIASIAAPPPANMALLLRKTSYPLDTIKALRLPVLFVVGEHDSIFTPDIVREAAEQITDATVKELPGAGHSPYFETPEQWNTEVLAFLRDD